LQQTQGGLAKVLRGLGGNQFIVGIHDQGPPIGFGGYVWVLHKKIFTLGWTLLGFGRRWGRGKDFVLQGRLIEAAQLQQVRGLLEAHPDWSRYRLSVELCRLWDWRAPNGQIKDMAARTLLLKLEQRGHLRLPAKRRASPNRMLHKQVRPVAHARETIGGPLAELSPVEVIELSQRQRFRSQTIPAHCYPPPIS
jgi:hypothetical protein